MVTSDKNNGNGYKTQKKTTEQIQSTDVREGVLSTNGERLSPKSNRLTVVVITTTVIISGHVSGYQTLITIDTHTR